MEADQPRSELARRFERERVGWSCLFSLLLHLFLYFFLGTFEGNTGQATQFYDIVRIGFYYDIKRMVIIGPRKQIVSTPDL